jgi:hypothetical protein
MSIMEDMEVVDVGVPIGIGCAFEDDAAEEEIEP